MSDFVVFRRGAIGPRVNASRLISFAKGEFFHFSPKMVGGEASSRS